MASAPRCSVPVVLRLAFLILLIPILVFILIIVIALPWKGRCGEAFVATGILALPVSAVGSFGTRVSWKSYRLGCPWRATVAEICMMMRRG